MNISRFFIDRPIFAAVLSIVVFIAGLLAMFKLPISEYPEVVPPTVVVRAQYPGANPKVISETVATPLEEAINGVENMLYMASQATSDGALTLTVTFKIGTNVEQAETQVQNRVQRSLPRLPDVVRQLGVITAKSSPNLTMVVHLKSPDERYGEVYLRNFAVLKVKDELARINGMGEVLVFGAGDYSMRIWLDPQKIAARGMTATDVIRAIREQNAQVAAGVVGGPPTDGKVEFQMAVNARGRLSSEEEFAEIIIKTAQDGSITKLSDVARIELGANQYALRSLLNNKPAVAVVVFQSPDANALQLSSDVRAKMEELKKTFPDGVEYSIVYDPTQFVRASIEEVVKTLLEALVLVVIVVVVFLQTWRASIIPLLAVPISIIGTFTFLYAFGFSINTLSLFGLVLAIGIVVDDAIVVVENVERNIEEGLAPKEATYKAMQEVSGPIIAIALTLCAVFVPIAFVSGLTGQFYKQFAITIAISTVISAFNSLTLSPALCAILLKGHNAPKDILTRFLDLILGWFFRGFNRVFKSASRTYSQTLVCRAIDRRYIMLVVYVLLIAATVKMFTMVPPGFVPGQDKQYLVGFTKLPDGASLDRTEGVIRRMSEIALSVPGVRDSVAFPGLSIAGFTNAPNEGIVFFGLDDFDKRKTPNLSGGAIAMAVNQKLGAIQDSFMAVFPPPAVMGLGTIGGFKLQLEDRAGLGYDALYQATKDFTAKMNPMQNGLFGFTTYEINVPQLYADVDRVKAKRQGVIITDIFDTLQIYLGSLYINDFNKFGRTYQVIAQADAPFRSHAEDIMQLKTRNALGEMVPLGSLMTVTPSYGPDRVTRYNAYPSADINGQAVVPGMSSGQAQAIAAGIAKEVLPNGITFEWTDLTYQEILAGNTMIYVFPLCVLLVFLVLAAQYENWSLPLAVILIVPMCILSAITGVFLFAVVGHMGGDNNIFTQIGFVVLVGLACKNAILIVEFAHELEGQGLTIVKAAIEACRLRLRPILMTSFAFIMGVIPLVLSIGAGSEIRQAMGIAVFSGMLGVTLFGLFLTPVFYVVIRSIATRTKPHRATPGPMAEVPAAPEGSKHG